VAGGAALGPGHSVLTFSGTFDNPTPLPGVSDPDPTICASGCQQWRLTVNTTTPAMNIFRGPKMSPRRPEVIRSTAYIRL